MSGESLVCLIHISLSIHRDSASLRCPLCVEGHIAPQILPSLASHPENETDNTGGGERGTVPEGGAARRGKRARPLAPPSARVFVGGIPFVTDAAAVRSALAAAAITGVAMPLYANPLF